MLGKRSLIYADVAGPGNNGVEAAIRLDFSACEASAPNSTDADAIKAARATSNQAIAKHETDAIVSFFDEEYVITTGAINILPGRDAQAGSWDEHFDELPDVVYVRSPADVTFYCKGEDCS